MRSRKPTTRGPAGETYGAAVRGAATCAGVERSRDRRLGASPTGPSRRPRGLGCASDRHPGQLLAGLPPLAIDLYLPALPSLTRSLHAAASTGQLTLTGFVAGLAMQLVAGALSDALGRRGLSACVAMLTATRCGRRRSGRCIGPRAGRPGAVDRSRHRAPRVRPSGRRARVRADAARDRRRAGGGSLIGGQLLRVTDWRGLFAVLGGLGALQLLVVARMLAETVPPERRHRGCA